MFSPFRVSLLGGGTDIPNFYNNHTGCVLGFASSLGCYLTINDTEIHNRKSAYKLIYSQTEEVNNLEEIRHPLIREYIKFFGYGGIEMHFNADLPSFSGLGTSSAFANAMSAGFSYLQGNQLSPKEIAEFSIYMERNILKEAGGIQDQVISAYGGCCLLEMNKNGWNVRKLLLNDNFKKNLLASLVLVKVGWGSKYIRSSSDIESHKVENKENINRLKSILDLTKNGIKFFNEENIREIGKTINDIWLIKKEFEGVSNPVVDECRDFLMSKGADGCRLLGAGGQGFFLGIGDPGYADKIVDILGKKKALKVKISDFGTRKMEIEAL